MFDSIQSQFIVTIAIAVVALLMEFFFNRHNTKSEHWVSFFLSGPTLFASCVLLLGSFSDLLVQMTLNPTSLVITLLVLAFLPTIFGFCVDTQIAYKRYRNRKPENKYRFSSLNREQKNNIALFGDPDYCYYGQGRFNRYSGHVRYHLCCNILGVSTGILMIFFWCTLPDAATFIERGAPIANVLEIIISAGIFISLFQVYQEQNPKKTFDWNKAEKVEEGNNSILKYKSNVYKFMKLNNNENSKNDVVAEKNKEYLRVPIYVNDDDVYVDSNGKCLNLEVNKKVKEIGNHKIKSSDLVSDNSKNNKRLIYKENPDAYYLSRLNVLTNCFYLTMVMSVAIIIALLMIVYSFSHIQMCDSIISYVVFSMIAICALVFLAFSSISELALSYDANCTPNWKFGPILVAACYVVFTFFLFKMSILIIIIMSVVVCLIIGSVLYVNICLNKSGRLSSINGVFGIVPIILLITFIVALTVSVFVYGF